MTEHTITDAMVEAAARALCDHYGAYDQDEILPLHVLSGPANERLPAWEYYSEEAKITLEAALAASPAGEVVDHPTFPRGTRVRFKSDTPAAAIIDWLELHEEHLTND